MFIRRVILLILSFACLLWKQHKVGAQTCPSDPTDSDVLGPFYIAGSPITDRLAPEDQLNVASNRIQIEGVIYGSDCVPMANVLVEPWYAGEGDENGDEYSMAGSSLSYRAQIRTDECGKYSFTSTFPAVYPQRPIRHIHFRISDDSSQFLVTQMYFEGHLIAGFNPAADQIVSLTNVDDGSRKGTWDIHLGVPGTSSASGCDAVPADPAPTPSPVSSVCFPSNAVVHVKDKGFTTMNKLAVGDEVLVGPDDKYEKVYSFGHKHGSTTAKYLSIQTFDATNPKKAPTLEISPDHMVLLLLKAGATTVVPTARHFVPASALSIGDALMTASGNMATIVSIKTVVRRGAYAPFTKSGQIVVNGLVASNYIAYQGTAEYLEIPGLLLKTPFTFQWLAHTYNSVHRVFAIQFGGLGKEESYNGKGMSHWVAGPHEIVRFILAQEDGSISMQLQRAATAACFVPPVLIALVTAVCLEVILDHLFLLLVTLMAATVYYLIHDVPRKHNIGTSTVLVVKKTK